MNDENPNTLGLIQALFTPKAVALVGASADVSKNNSRPQRFLRRHGYGGRILPINPRHREIFGETAYPDLRSAPGPIDHAFIMVPAAAVPEVVAQCCALKIPVATIFSAGFAELGEDGLRRQREMVAMARASGVRLLGPNCMGLINVRGRTALSVNAVLERETLRQGPLSVISQSGSTLGTLISRAQARGLGFSKLVSVGNECDLAVGELAELLADDAETGAILLFLETFRDAERLALAARRAYVAGKPVIAYKLGRSDVGRRAAASHTGAMVGADELASAFFRAHGIMRVDMLESLFELPQLVMGRKPPAGRRVAVLTGTGGAAAMVADRLGVLRAEVVAPPPALIEKLQNDDLPINDAPITDIPMGRSESGAYTAILSALLGSDHCDAVVAVIGSSSQNPETLVERVFKAGGRDRKPLAVFLAPRADDGLLALQERGIAGFRTPESCADAVNAFLNWRVPVLQESPAAAELEQADALAATAQAGANLNEYEACTLFAALGIPQAQSRIVADAAQCSAIVIEFPVAVKLLSPDIAHKTEAEMVELDVSSGANLRAAVQRMLNRARERLPQARIDGVLVQRMERGLAEVIVGYRRDPEVGPIVMLGAGGVTAEIKRSYCVRLAPVGLATAMEMIEEVPELAILRGFRNLPRGDCTALARAIRAMSLLACLKNRVVNEAEINPLIVKGEGGGVIAVDGLVVCA
ncbi:MAG: acetate--CoA ligase family protein [Betaproteobacteria bacterium]|nr:acetate--CoA ligase family protein [Betaproteobacteria bacterium]